MATRAPGPSGKIRQRRIAELVADQLRERILSGAYDGAGELPKQDDLFREFRVSMPSVREALRILETEGLVEVRRGSLGGAVVHRPEAASAAYMLGLVLQADAVPLADVIEAIRQIEPLCAAACARRPDRATGVLPVLRATLDEASAAVGDPGAYAALARRFHHEVVALCANATMALVVGALESLWSAHVDALARGTDRFGTFAQDEARKATAQEHEAIYDAIAHGDADAAARAARDHFDAPAPDGEPRRHDFDLSTVVGASLVRDRSRARER